MSDSALFRPFSLRGLQLPNRIVIAPMCEYSAIEGCANDWHLIHLGHLSLSGAGLLMIEATAVELRGRITRECLGLYTDENERMLGRVLNAVRKYTTMPLGIQLSHAGRKASRLKPSDGRAAIPMGEGNWRVVGPSPIAFGDDWQTPHELEHSDLRHIRDSFAQSTVRAARLGLDLLELHAAHGYLLSSFLSPIANQRTDGYGGSIDNRMRFPLEVFEAVRRAWPQDRPLGVRCNATDWDERGIQPEEAVVFASALRDLGCDFVEISSGSNSLAPVPLSPGYQVPLAARVRREASIPTIAVGMIRDPRHAEAIVARGDADLVAIARGMLDNPRWPWHAARLLGAQVEQPYQYARAVKLEPYPLRESET